MNTVSIITRKRDGYELSRDEIKYIVDGYTSGRVPDYQMSAFLMAVYFRGMNKRETVDLTDIMRVSGDIVDLSGIRGVKVDKHSTGGVGDKTTLIVGPVAAACGVPVAKMSGRGLGFTGGTVDKLESIPGFRTSIEREVFMDLVNRNGIAVIGQTGHIAPADKKIYALRDVTGTVENLSLITSSIMSKKLAAGSDAILLDVKCGSGAFMKTREDAEKLAEMMVEIGNSAGRETIALITDMRQPLGNAIGNSLEVLEAIDVLRGRGPEDITKLSVILAGYMVYLGKKARAPREGIMMAMQAIEDGSALEKFRTLVSGQGGDPGITEDPGLMPVSRIKKDIKAKRSGYVTGLDAMRVGLASQHAGAGREEKDDEIDLSAGILLKKKLGDKVQCGDVLCTVCGNDELRVSEAEKEMNSVFEVNAAAREVPDLIKGIVDRTSADR